MLTGYCSLVPSYGRDYKNKKDVIADFLAGKDFTHCCPTGTTQCSIRDFAPGAIANLRYKQRTMVTVLEITEAMLNE